MAKKDAKQNNIAKTYYDIVNELSVKTTGFSADNIDKYFKTNSQVPEVIGSLTKSFNIEYDKSVTNVNWKKGKEDLNELLENKLNDVLIKEVLYENMNSYTNEKLREHLYIRRYMPQVERVLTAKVDAVMSPNTQTRERVDIELMSGDKTLLDIKNALEEVQLNKITQETLLASYSHGAAFVYVYPYSEIANDIMNLKDEALFSATIGDDKKSMLFGESWQTSPELTKEGLVTLAKFKLSAYSDYYSESSADGIPRAKLISKDSAIASVYSTIVNTYDSDDILIKESSSADGLLVTTSNKNKMKKIKNLTGCHVKKLDNLRCIPIYIADELIGVYYIDSLDHYASMNNRASMMATSKTGGLHTSGIPLEMKIKLDIIKEMKTEISEKFLFDNKNILVSLDQILKDTAMDTRYKIRFIPRKYLVEFPHHMRVSNIQIVESLALWWIDLMKNYVFKKLFYEKDKFITYYTVDKNDDISGLAYRTVDAMRNLVPNPADILNIKRKHTSLVNLHSIVIPQTPNKNRPVEFEVKEGQKAVVDEFEDLLKLQSQVTELLGFNYNALDPSANTDFALNIIASDQNKAETILVDQAHYNRYLNELVNKILGFKFPNTDCKVKATFPEQRVLKSQMMSDQLTQITSRIDAIVKYMASDKYEDDKGYTSFMQRALLKEYASMVFDSVKYEKYEEEYERKKKSDANKGVGEGKPNSDDNGGFS